MSQSDLYLDIDGVILGKRDPGDPDVVLANGAEAFLGFCLARFDCYWLTTHCRGDVTAVVEYLGRYASGRCLLLAKKFRPTRFDVFKTEAIHIERPFFWIDDSPLASELDFLRRHRLLDRWIAVDTRKRPDDLARAQIILAQRAGQRNGNDGAA